MIFLLSLLGIGAGLTNALSVHDLPEIPENGDLWVLLVAGSNGWFNYRHQADVCHAYQIVHAHGVPDDHIIVMMYDDIAYAKENPTPGKIINHPNGTDVYKGVPKDYVCSTVRPDVFLKVLKGEKIENIGSGKTLASGPNDNVFVYFTDHGAKGLVAFGENFLKATNLTSAIKEMHEAKKYKKMVFYVEACESGSMFKGLLPENINVYATTASNATTSSFACYYDKERHTFLGDVYSIKWMEDSDKKNIEQESLDQQYSVVKKETNTSTVCRFGDLSMGQLKVGEFQGPKENVLTKPPPYPYPHPSAGCGATAVPGPEVPVRILERTIQDAETPEDRLEAQQSLEKLRTNRKFMEDVVWRVITGVTGDEGLTQTVVSDNVELTKYDCYYTAVDAFHEKCFNVGRNDYALRMLNGFVNLCERGFKPEDITSAIQMSCVHPQMYGIH